MVIPQDLELIVEENKSQEGTFPPSMIQTPIGGKSSNVRMSRSNRIIHGSMDSNQSKSALRYDPPQTEDVVLEIDSNSTPERRSKASPGGN